MRALRQLLGPRAGSEELPGTGEGRDAGSALRAWRRAAPSDILVPFPSPRPLRMPRASAGRTAPEHAPGGNLHGRRLELGLHRAAVCGCARTAPDPPTAGTPRGPSVRRSSLRSTSLRLDPPALHLPGCPRACQQTCASIPGAERVPVSGFKGVHLSFPAPP